jgi:hypothetical protein
MVRRDRLDRGGRPRATGLLSAGDEAHNRNESEAGANVSIHPEVSP